MRDQVTADTTGVSTTAETHLLNVRVALERLDVARLHRIADRLYDAHRTGQTIYTLGNGGCAAMANHFAADLARLTQPGPTTRAVRVVSLAANTALLTACANDVAFDQVFVEQLRGILLPGDVVVGFSTSGTSANVIHAVRHARTAGATTVGLTGCGGTLFAASVDEALVIDSTHVQVLEDVMLVALHSLSLLTRDRRLAAGD